MSTTSEDRDSGAAGPRTGEGAAFRIELVLALKARRERAGLSSDELGRLAGLGPRYVARMEGGRINVRVSTVVGLFKILNSREPANRQTLAAMRELVQFIEDLRGSLGKTREILKRGWGMPSAQPQPDASTTTSTRVHRTRLPPAAEEPVREGRTSMPDEPGFTLADLLAMVDKKLGSKKATRAHLGDISSQRLYSATHGGPPLRSERVVRLAVTAGVEPTDALRAGGHRSLAALLEESYLPRLQNVTIEEGEFLAHLRQLAPDAREMVRRMAALLASQQQAVSESGELGAAGQDG